MSNVNLRAAIVSNLAYGDAEGFQAAGFTNICAITDTETDTECFLVEDDKYIYFTARGTEKDLVDLRTDMRFLQKEVFSKYNLHRGFYEAYRSIAPELTEELWPRRLEQDMEPTTRKPLVFCGHSLGGAIATIAAASHGPDYLITFGQPPVGGKAFAMHMDGLATTYTRFVLDGDPVPRLLKWNPKYRHCGKRAFIDDEMNVHENPSFWFMLKKRLPFIYDIDDHSMKWYRSALWANGDLL